jgi:hypothetical protein
VVSNVHAQEDGLAVRPVCFPESVAGKVVQDILPEKGVPVHSNTNAIQEDMRTAKEVLLHLALVRAIMVSTARLVARAEEPCIADIVVFSVRLEVRNQHVPVVDITRCP